MVSTHGLLQSKIKAMRCRQTLVLTGKACCRIVSPLSSSSPSPKPLGKPVSLEFTVVRKAFSDARRRALLTQGVVTIEKIRANQLTMKSVS